MTDVAFGQSLDYIESRISAAHAFQPAAFRLFISREERDLESIPFRCRLCRAAFERFKRMAMPSGKWVNRYHFVVWSTAQDFARAHHERWWRKTQTRADHFALRIKLREYPRGLWEQAVTIGCEFL